MSKLKINAEAFRLYYGYDLKLSDEDFRKEFFARYNNSRSYAKLEGLLIVEGFPQNVAVETALYEIQKRELQLQKLSKREDCAMDDLKFMIGRLLSLYERDWINSGNAEEKAEGHSPRLIQILNLISKRHLPKKKMDEMAHREDELKRKHNL